MSKHYFPLVSILFFLVIIVGSIAFYRSFLSTPPRKAQDVVAVLPSPNPTETQVLGSISSVSAVPKVSLTIDSPLAEASVSSSLLSVAGKTATQAAVTVNDKKFQADELGNFKTNIKLNEGANLIVIEASKSGENAVWQTIVTYAP